MPPRPTNKTKKGTKKMTGNKQFSRWMSLAPIGALAAALIYLAFTGQPPLYS